MRFFLRLLYISSLLVAVVFAVVFLLGLYKDESISSVGIMLVISGLLQLEVSGSITKIIAYYSNEEKFPYGPPSHVTRTIADNPDTPCRTILKNLFFHNPHTGLWLIVLGSLVQLVSLWV